MSQRDECAGCGTRACPECLEECYECSRVITCECDLDVYLSNPGMCPCEKALKYCEACRGGVLQREHCGEWVCAKHHKWHDDTAEAATEENIYHGGCSKCILHHRKVRDTLVREVERNLLLGSKDRAAPAKDAPKATVLLDRLVRTGQAPMASVVLDFAGGRRNNGPRSRMPRPKLRAKKDTRMKAPRKMLAKLNGPWPEKPRRVVEGRL